VYHGSHLVIQIPDINYGRYKLDFGKGFYATTIQAQAEKWAQRRAKAEQGKPVISVYEFDIQNLKILSFAGYTAEWLDFVVKNRNDASQQHQYDAIYGNMANDDVATIVNDYIRLLRRGRIDADGKHFYLRQLQYSEPNNQYCIATQKGINALQFIKSYVVDKRHV
jgi:hypothetical protein